MSASSASHRHSRWYASDKARVTHLKRCRHGVRKSVDGGLELRQSLLLGVCRPTRKLCGIWR